VKYFTKDAMLLPINLLSGLKSCVARLVYCFSFQFPAEVEGLAGSLRMLDISENRIPTIPPSISQFTMIKSLQISSNRLSMFSRPLLGMWGVRQS